MFVGLVGCVDGGLADGPSTPPDASVATDASDTGVVDAATDLPTDAVVDASDLKLLGADPEVELSERIEAAADVKFPMLGAHEDRVYLAGTRAQQATLWTKTALASFTSYEELGAARGQADYAATALNVRADGALDVGILDQSDEKARPTTISVRTRPALATSFGAPRVIVSDMTFRPFLALTAAKDGVFVFWDQGERVWFSREGAAPAIAVDSPPGTFARATLRSDGSPLFVHAADGAWAGVWSAGKFTRETIQPAQGDTGPYYASPSAATLPDGRVVVAMRSVKPGVHLATRDLSGKWTTTTPFADTAGGTVSVVADPLGQVHLFWAVIAKDPTQNGVKYAFRRADGTWSKPALAVVADFVNHASGAITWKGGFRAHVVVEDFGGAGMRTRYVRFAVP